MTIQTLQHPIGDLPIDIQRKIIDYCIKEKSLKVLYEDKLYELPAVLQITYFCKECSQSFPVRAYTTDLIIRRISSQLQCPNCKQRMNIYYKTIPLAYRINIGNTNSKSNLMDYFED